MDRRGVSGETCGLIFYITTGRPSHGPRQRCKRTPPIASKMGSSASKQPTKEEVVCLDCQIETQQPLPSSDANASHDGDCHEIYLRVDQCMRQYNHQVTKCNEEWKAFRECREKNVR